jgi:DNA-binding transcriptional LysR family regulator
MILDHLEKLLHFTGVAKSRSIRGYAQANNISQPAVSKSLQLLESSLETTLLVRNRDGCELTERKVESAIAEAFN